MSYTTTDFGMFSAAGNAAVAEIVREARDVPGVVQGVEYLLNELEYLGKEHFPESDDTAVREAAMTEFFKEGE